MCKDIWVGLQQLYPNDICYSKEKEQSYQFFRGFKVVRNSDTTINIYNTHINDYYIDKYGIQQVTQYPLVKNIELLNTIKSQIYVEIDNIKDILSS